MQQLSLWSREPHRDTLQYIVDLAAQMMAENPTIEFSSHFISPMCKKLERHGFVLGRNSNINRGRKPRLMVDILIATSPPIAVEIKAEKQLLTGTRYQVSQYSRCFWTAGTLLLNFIVGEKRVDAWWVAQGKSFDDPDVPRLFASPLQRGIGRGKLNIPIVTVCDTLKITHSVGGAAEELKCSRGYIYKVLGQHGLKPQEVISGAADWGIGGNK